MKQIENKLITGLIESLKTLETPIVIIPHMNPDGDAIGSSLGFGRVLRNSGKIVSVIAPDSFPSFYKWMTGSRDIILYNNDKKKADEKINEAGMIICMDFNEISRTGNMASVIENFKGKRILIDHHPEPQCFADITFSYPDSSSSSELAFHIINEMGYENFIDKESAECLYCGIMTDTGSFDYSIRDPQTFRSLSDLITYSIDPIEIHHNVFDTYSEDRMRLLGYCLSEGMEVFPEYNAAMISLPRDIQKRFNYVKGDNEGFVNYPLSIKGIRFSVLFSEIKDQVKVSLRSTGSFSVTEIARDYYNGGGHCNASGGEISNMSLEEVKAQFRKNLPEYIKNMEKEKEGK